MKPLAELIEPIVFRVIGTDFTLEDVGGGLWAIRRGSECLTDKGEWIYEPLPSNRDDAFKRKTRFQYEHALHMALKLGAPQVPT